jgi:hypothetical protein
MVKCLKQYVKVDIKIEEGNNAIRYRTQRKKFYAGTAEKDLSN